MKVPAHWRWQAMGRAGGEAGIVFTTAGGLNQGGIRATAIDASYKGGVLSAIPEGYSISGIRAWILGTGAAQVPSLYLTHITPGGGAGVLIDTVAPIDPPAVFAIYTKLLAVPFVLPAGGIVHVSAGLPLVGTEIAGFAVRLQKL